MTDKEGTPSNDTIMFWRIIKEEKGTECNNNNKYSQVFGKENNFLWQSLGDVKVKTACGEGTLMLSIRMFTDAVCIEFSARTTRGIFNTACSKWCEDILTDHAVSVGNRNAGTVVGQNCVFLGSGNGSISNCEVSGERFSYTSNGELLVRFHKACFSQEKKCTKIVLKVKNILPYKDIYW